MWFPRGAGSGEPGAGWAKCGHMTATHRRTVPKNHAIGW